MSIATNRCSGRPRLAQQAAGTGAAAAWKEVTGQADPDGQPPWHCSPVGPRQTRLAHRKGTIMPKARFDARA
jgi:hypothetical protein